MEQRIGSKSQPLDAAAVDPAYIPGLTSPVPAEPKDAAERSGEAAAEETSSAAAPAPAASGEPASEEAVSAEPPADAAPEDPGAVSEADGEDAGAEPDGPVFEASDRRASIRADHTGVRLRLDDQEAEFRWDEIGAVETTSPRFGKRFTVTVHTPDRRWYPIEIEATSRSRFAEWDEQLDAVLDRYFEDDAEAEPESEEAELTDSATEPSGEPESAGSPETAEKAGTGETAETGEKPESPAGGTGKP
ncbi:hypothetical protein AB0912_06145 [Streptomyces sp. NPDC007084]|uniref:hypothetical protein n=1 Tax=Streptomyces sp. NPDC007084 TaxID=3154313 RepID=UPI00345300EF